MKYPFGDLTVAIPWAPIQQAIGEPLGMPVKKMCPEKARIVAILTDGFAMWLLVTVCFGVSGKYYVTNAVRKLDNFLTTLLYALCSFDEESFLKCVNIKESLHAERLLTN